MLQFNLYHFPHKLVPAPGIPDRKLVLLRWSDDNGSQCILPGPTSPARTATCSLTLVSMDWTVGPTYTFPETGDVSYPCSPFSLQHWIEQFLAPWRWEAACFPKVLVLPVQHCKVLKPRRLQLNNPNHEKCKTYKQRTVYKHLKSFTWEN